MAMCYWFKNSKNKNKILNLNQITYMINDGWKINKVHTLFKIVGLYYELIKL